MSLNSNPGDPAADSYFSLAEALTYFTGRGIAAWTGSDAILETAARRGTTYLENQYRERWVGIRATQPQSLAWPRVDGSRGNQTTRGLGYAWTFPLFDIDGFLLSDAVVPAQIKTAAMEAALLTLSGVVLEPQLVRGGQIKSLSDTVGPISETTVWQDGASPLDRYTVIEGILRGLVTSTPGSASGNTRLVRA
jgi:hypothetical protein